MGVWAVRNTVDGKALVGASPNAAGRLNRERFTLEVGDHPSRDLQAD
ncbi:MAG: GIY-YIG nuclease family protein [Actinomycetota bacterium]|nr:GIY-YIG nuclease family protein [Actinomycetota bacterium]